MYQNVFVFSLCVIIHFHLWNGLSKMKIQDFGTALSLLGGMKTVMHCFLPWWNPLVHRWWCILWLFSALISSFWISSSSSILFSSFPGGRFRIWIEVTVIVLLTVARLLAPVRKNSIATWCIISKNVTRDIPIVRPKIPPMLATNQIKGTFWSRTTWVTAGSLMYTFTKAKFSRAYLKQNLNCIKNVHFCVFNKIKSF